MTLRRIYSNSGTPDARLFYPLPIQYNGINLLVIRSKRKPSRIRLQTDGENIIDISADSLRDLFALKGVKKIPHNWPVVFGEPLRISNRASDLLLIVEFDKPRDPEAVWVIMQ